MKKQEIWMPLREQVGEEVESEVSTNLEALYLSSFPTVFAYIHFNESCGSGMQAKPRILQN